MINKIKKELEKISTTKEKIKFLMIKLREIDDKTIKKQIEEIVNQLIEREDLEERVEIRQEYIETSPIRPAVSVLEDQLPTLIPKRRAPEIETEKVDYKIAKSGSKYEPVEVLEVTKGDPTRKDTITESNLTPLNVGEMYESQSVQEDQRYINNQEVRDEMQVIQTERIEQSDRTATEEQLKRDKLDIKYKLT
jgi:hypothetical protein